LRRPRKHFNVVLGHKSLDYVRGAIFDKVYLFIIYNKGWYDELEKMEMKRKVV